MVKRAMRLTSLLLERVPTCPSSAQVPFSAAAEIGSRRLRCEDWGTVMTRLPLRLGAWQVTCLCTGERCGYWEICALSDRVHCAFVNSRNRFVPKSVICGVSKRFPMEGPFALAGLGAGGEGDVSSSGVGRLCNAGERGGGWLRHNGCWCCYGCRGCRRGVSPFLPLSGSSTWSLLVARGRASGSANRGGSFGAR